MVGATPSDNTVRIILACVPRLMAALIRQVIANCHDMEIVGDTSDGQALEDIVATRRVDVVVTCSRDSDAAIWLGQLLLGRTHIPILVLDTDGRRLAIYDRRIIREVSPGQLIDVIREIVRDRHPQSIS